MGGNPLVPIVLGGDPLIPIMQGGISPIPMSLPPSSMATSFDWSQLVGYHLTTYVPFQVIIYAYNMNTLDTVIDEGASVSILCLTL